VESRVSATVSVAWNAALTSVELSSSSLDARIVLDTNAKSHRRLTDGRMDGRAGVLGFGGKTAVFKRDAAYCVQHDTHCE